MNTFLAYARNRFVISIAALTVGIGISFAVPHVSSSQTFVGSYQATSCPALGNGYTSVELTSSQVGIRNIRPKSSTLNTHHQLFQPLGSSPLFVDSTYGSSYTLASKGGVAAALCQPGAADQWFVGGSGTLTSAGVLEVVNSGLSGASVEIHPYSSKASLPTVLVRVNANSDKRVRLDSLVPGDDLMALEVITRAGRVTSFMFDQRKKGLSNLGMDYVAAGSAPSTHLVIPIGRNSVGSNKLIHALRLLAPGQVNATVTVQLQSEDGSFTPVGLDSKVIVHGKVTEIPLSKVISSTPFSLSITSDQPVVASLFTQGYGDFAWGSSAEPFSKMALNLAGLTPSFTFTGKKISVAVQGQLASGKKFSRTLTGDSFVAWSPGGKVKSITFESKSKSPVYGGALIAGQNGFTYLPLQSNTTPTATLLPITDVHTLTR